MRYWGVTGTNGKTTTAWILAEFMNAPEIGRKAGYITTVEVNTGSRKFYTGYTTPPLAQLKEIYAEMEANGVTDCVMEVSSHAIHQHRTGDTPFAGGAFTNLSEDHLDYHKTMAAYFDVKLDFARQIAAAHPAPTPELGRKDLPPYVVCLDGGYGEEMFKAVGNLPLNVIPVSNAKPTFVLDGLQLVGDYNRSNVLVAATLAEASGVPHDAIQAKIPHLKPRWGRLERVENPSVQAEVYVDFAHTPDGLEKVLAAARGFCRGKLWVVFGAGGDRDPMKRPLMGEACSRLADRCVVTSDNPRSEDPMTIIQAVLTGMQPGALVEPDRAKAIALALSQAERDDVVIIAGKGHETTQEIKGIKHPFDDREQVRNYPTMNISRKTFIESGLIAAAVPKMGFAALPKKSITIARTSCAFEREPMIRPFGFKGGYLTEEWIVSSFIQSSSGKHGIGLGTQSSLWSDAKVFAQNSECGGNAIMFSMTQYALKLLVGQRFTSPVELNDWLWPQVWEYGKKVAANDELRATYALNALVSVDNALWVLFARENGLTSFDEMIPDEYHSALSAHHAKCASIPLFSYKVPVAEIKSAVESGYFFMKIKIGQPGTQAEMLAKDMARVSEIHAVLKDCRTPYTKSGKLPYYFDANGRYESKETFLKFVDHLKKIGAYEQVAIVEEPFDEHADIDVNDIPLRLAADESAHTVNDALKRIQMGYRAMALKPIAKTMSMSMKIAAAACERDIPCFCADLTVCPALVEWNKSVAARLPAFPGIGDLGLVETNGHMNFRNWETMRNDLAYPKAHWTRTEHGVFECDDDYYAKSGGILEPMARYEKLFAAKAI